MLHRFAKESRRVAIRGCNVEEFPEPGMDLGRQLMTGIPHGNVRHAYIPRVGRDKQSLLQAENSLGA